MKNLSFAIAHPDLIKEWHPTKNGDLTPSDVSVGSNKKVWWKCPKGDDHEWQALVIKRHKGNNCPFCSNHKVAKSNCLKTTNPKLAKEWHPTKNGGLTPLDVTAGSGKKVWWKCPMDNNHEWQAFINNRNKGIGCPICANKKTIKANSLDTLNPKLAKEWHPTKNGALSPSDVTPGSNKKVWWKCPKGDDHEWETYVSFRSRGRGCPHCKGSSTSSPEIRLYCELKTIFPNTKNRTKIKNQEVDIYIPELNLAIEYDGEYWHRNKVESDKLKNKIIGDQAFLLRIREKGLSKITSTDIILKHRELKLTTIKHVLNSIKENITIEDSTILKKIELYLNRSNWAASSTYKKLIHEKNDTKIYESISYLYPKLVKEWHQTKNIPLIPENYTPGSNKKVWWKCPRGDDHEWKASIVSRTQGVGCPICNNKKIVDSNSLATLNPKLARQWHPTKNGDLTPNDVSVGSNKKVWWKCPKGDDHEWLTSVAHRASGKGCPICSNHKVVKSNSLATLNPKLARQWHPTKNGDLTPNDVSVGSNKKVWWKCPKGDDHEWQAIILTRNNGLGCPICSNQKTTKSNCLKNTNPKLAKEWHPIKNEGLTPFDFTAGSGKSVWWKAKCGHEWKTSIRNRSSGKGCPYCKHLKAKITRRKNKFNNAQLELTIQNKED